MIYAKNYLGRRVGFRCYLRDHMVAVRMIKQDPDFDVPSG